MKKALLFICFLLFLSTLSFRGFSIEISSIDSLTSTGTALDFAWRYHSGDDSLWSRPEFDDAGWDTIDHEDFPKEPSLVNWYRVWFKINPALAQKPVAIIISQTGASVIFLDGKKLKRYGIVSGEKKMERGYDPQNFPLITTLSSDTLHLLAIRYSNHITTDKNRDYGPEIRLAEPTEYLHENLSNNHTLLTICDILIGFFSGLTFLHLMLYYYYKADKNNLYYSIYTILLLLILVWYHTNLYHSNSMIYEKMAFMAPISYPLFFYWLTLLVSRLFDSQRRRHLWIATGFTALTILIWILNIDLSYDFYSYLFFTVIFSATISTFFTIYYAIKRKIDGAIILGIGFLFFAIFIFTLLSAFLIVISFTNHHHFQFEGVYGFIFIVLIVMAVISIPISMSVYLARNFAVKSITLTKKLEEVEQLSAHNLIQAKEKEEILFSQNEMLENLVNKRTAEVTDQKNKLEIKNREILDSLNYARYLQQVILPPLSYINEKVKDSFVIYKPKDIVAGDFYYAEESGSHFFVAAADCTGHGVPGAMLSVICSNALNQAIKEFSLTTPGKILDKVNELVSVTFEKSKQDVNDGMDISLLAINQAERTVKWSGANNHLWYMMNDSLHEIKGDKQPIGKYHNRIPFQTHVLPWTAGNWFYLFTDGYADQFGGKEGKKFMRKNLFDLFVSLHQLPASAQKIMMEETLANWTGNYYQVDDITVIGIEI